ncbi:MAG: cation:proton antiporter [Bacteroidota bacterium]
MEKVQDTIILLLGFGIVAVASNHISKLFKKIKLPLITGLLIVGVASGPFVLRLIPHESKIDLSFINDISLAFIAFAASAELYLKELRSRFKSIKWMTFGQLVITFTASSIAIYFLSEFIPFMNGLSSKERIAISILAGTIFVARSPASAIAVINEVRARGPFTQTAMGVTVLKDFLVIILFAINFSVSNALVKGIEFNLIFLGILILELIASFALGFLLSYILKFILSLRVHVYAKTAYILISGYSMYALYYFLKDITLEHFGKEFLIEPLLICIIGSFLITNYSKFRHEFIKILDDTGPFIYIAFFTLAGSSMSLDLFTQVASVALMLFVIRLVTMIVGAYVGGTLAGDPPLFNRIGWMPYVTQAGVGLGLATIVANNFTGWGNEFATVIIATIVINQIIGPPLFKWSLNMVGETHERAETPKFDGIRDAIIFGMESQSIALARQLQEHGWLAKIATLKPEIDEDEYEDLEIVKIDALNLDTLEKLDAKLSEAIVLMLTDEENYEICELIYENIGTKEVIVRLNHRYNVNKFHDLGARIVDPDTAIVSLMDHFVRSPEATSLLLGMRKDQDTIDLEVLNPDLHGIPLRDLRLPSDIILLSVKRGGQSLITHGYTRLRLGDQITVVGSVESLNNLTLRFDR